jgi:hypothetical protein
MHAVVRLQDLDGTIASCSRGDIQWDLSTDQRGQLISQTRHSDPDRSEIRNTAQLRGTEQSNGATM